MPDVGQMKLVVGWSVAEQLTDRRRPHDSHKLVAERTRTHTVQGEVDAVVEAIRHRGDVLGCQKTDGETAGGTRRCGRVEIDVVEEQSKPTDAVRDVEDNERR